MLTQDAPLELGRTLYYSQEELALHTPFSEEDLLTRAIESGDEEALRSVHFSPSTGHLGILSTDPLRQAQYMFVSAVAVASRAAIRGGLDAEIAYSTADLYCQRMDLMRDPHQIHLFMQPMMMDFCHKVAELQDYRSYSAAVRRCCEAIHRASHTQLSLRELSEVSGISPARLSERFHKETGMTVVEYTHRVRLREAEYLLRRTHRSISEIAQLLGFSSQSYFTALFRRYYRQTPGEYRK